MLFSSSFMENLNRNVDCGEPQWFVMRDLTRPNAKRPAYVLLEEAGIRCFTPMVWKVCTMHGRSERRHVPVIHDLLFVHSTQAELDPFVESIGTFQYRFLRNLHNTPMTVRSNEMECFIRAVGSCEQPQYLSPDEVTPAMCNRRIRIIGGRLDGCEGYLLTTRGSRRKRLLVELPSLLAAAVEVEPEYIQLI